MNRALNYRVLNLIVFAVVLFAAVMNYETWSGFNGSAGTVALKPEAGLGNQPLEIASAAKEESESFQSYGMIAEKNIFSSDRKEFTSPSLPLAEAPKSTRPQVILSGVVISEDYQSASVSSPGRLLKKGERETMSLKPGDRIGEYKVTKIEADRITMEAAGDSFEVLLYDPGNPKKRVEMKSGIQAINETRTTQPAPAVGTAKVEVMGNPMEPMAEKAIASASPSQGKDVPPAEVRWRKSMRLSRMGSNQQNTGIVESTPGNRDGSSALEKMKMQ